MGWALCILLVPVLSGLPELPHAPTGLATSTTVALTWEPPPDGGEPIVAYAISGGLLGGPVRPIYDPLLAGDAGDPYRRELTVRGLRPRTAYFFQLCAVNREGRSAWSAPAQFDTKPPLVRVSGISPMAGPRAGGTRLTVSGTDIRFGEIFKCAFGGTVVPATLSAPSAEARARHAQLDAFVLDVWGFNDTGIDRSVPSTLECITPAVPASSHLVGDGAGGGGSVRLWLSSYALPLAVSADGSAFSDGIPFSFYDDALPVSVTPVSGPLGGGTAVTVRSAQRVPARLTCLLASTPPLLLSLILQLSLARCAARSRATRSPSRPAASRLWAPRATFPAPLCRPRSRHSRPQSSLFGMPEQLRPQRPIGPPGVPEGPGRVLTPRAPPRLRGRRAARFEVPSR